MINSTASATVQAPVRTEGPVRLTGRLYLCSDYPEESAALARYLTDLEAMRVAGEEDHRPFQGPLDLRYDQNTSSTLSLLQSNLGLTTNDFSTVAITTGNAVTLADTNALALGASTISATHCWLVLRVKRCLI